MSAVDPFAPGSTVLTYRLGERVGTSVWSAEDTRSGKRVAIKILTRQLPREPARRDALVRDLRMGAALYHSSLVHIIELAVAGDALLLVMDWFESKSLSSTFRGKPASRDDFFHLAYQLGDVVKLLHAKDVIHGNIAGDSVLVAASGQLRLAGLNATNLLPKRDTSTSYQQRGGDLRAVSYMAPEQVGGQPLTPQSDVFSIGTVLYEMALGRPPYLGETAAEVAQKILHENPASPKSINPAIDNAVLSVMGKCLFKDPFKRQKDARSLVDDIVRADPGSVQFANDLARAAASLSGPSAPVEGSVSGSQASRNAILFIADIANYEQLKSVDPPSAARSVARMQQILGEAVYLFDGSVLDPFSPRMIAELPTVESALEAARKGEFDFSIEQQGTDLIPVRMLLHAGEIRTEDGEVGGAAVGQAVEVLAHLEPLQLFITEDFVKRGRGNVRLRDAGARSGMKLYEIAPAEEAAKKAKRAEVEAATIAAAEAEAAAAASAAKALAEGKKKRTRLAIIVGATVLVLALGVFLFRPKRAELGPAVHVAATLPAPTAATPRKILLQPFHVEPADPAMQQRADAVRSGAAEILATFPELRVVDAPGSDVSVFGADVRGSGPAAQFVPSSGGKQKAVPAAFLDGWSGVQSMVGMVLSELQIPRRVVSTPEAGNALLDAINAIASKNDPVAETALRASMKADPALLPAQLVAMKFFGDRGKDADALVVARQAAGLDPANPDVARVMARAALKGGDAVSAMRAYAVILKAVHLDAEALNAVGKYALSAGDVRLFTACARKLGTNIHSELQEPDVLVASGKIDAAVSQYYDVEQKIPNNPFVHLKIGRVAVLRHSKEIAETELKDLQRLHFDYGIHLIRAYLAAEAQNPSETSAELKAAEAYSVPGDDYQTSRAEVAALRGDAGGTMDALEQAAARQEPTASYVLANPLFGFLHTDARFVPLKQKLKQQQADLQAALQDAPR